MRGERVPYIFDVCALRTHVPVYQHQGSQETNQFIWEYIRYKLNICEFDILNDLMSVGAF